MDENPFDWTIFPQDEHKKPLQGVKVQRPAQQKKSPHILNPAPQGRQNLLRGGTEKVFEAGEKIVSNLKMPNEMQNAVFLQIGGWDTDGETSRQSSQSRATCLHTVEWSVYYWEIRTNIN